MIIGITGSSGAGKSTVCEMIEKTYNSKTITADKIARKLSEKGTEYLNEIIQRFGNNVLTENGDLNRRKLANIIYSSSYYGVPTPINQVAGISVPEARMILIQPWDTSLLKEIEKEIKNSNNKIITIDAPLLIEADMKKLCDTTIAVVSEDKEIQIQRIIERDKIDRKHAVARLGAQHPNEFYTENCEYTIVNNEKLEEQIKNVIEKIMLNF